MGGFEIRDPIHGSIFFDEEEKIILDHPFVQRLRHIRQLGFVCLVYPGGTNDRFSHSVGVMHIAGRLFDSFLKRTPVLTEIYTAVQLAYLRRCVRFAGLLHDVGHPPVSHASEILLPDLDVLNLPKKWFDEKLAKRKARHEDFTLWLVNALGEEKCGLTPDMAQDVASLIHAGVKPVDKGKNFQGRDGWNVHGLLRSVISGECDADRMDYLLRDSHNCGVTYGMYDLNRIVHSVRTYMNENTKQVHWCLDADGIFSFEDFLLARYHMFLQVYLHKTVLCFDYFLQKAFEEGEIKFPKLSGPEDYMSLTDHHLWVWLAEAAKKEKNTWSRRLMTRAPARRLLQLSHLDTPDLDLDETAEKIKAKLKREGIFHFALKSTPYLSQAGNQHVPQSFVHRPTLEGKDRFVPLQRYSRLIEKYNDRIYSINVYVWHEDAVRARGVIASMVS